MKLIPYALLAAGLVMSVAAHGQSGSGGAKVNGVSIPQSRIDAALKGRVAQGQPDTPQLRESIKEALVTQEIVAQEAARKGLDKNPEIAATIDLNRKEILVNAYIQDYFRSHPLSDEAMRKEYERLKPQIPTHEYKARHILVENESEAKEIIAQIKQGASFEKIANEKSKDPGAKGSGGDLGWGPVGRYVKPFGDALAKLKKGQMTDAPVQTSFGWHVIRLDDERAAKIPSFDEAKPQ